MSTLEAPLLARWLSGVGIMAHLLLASMFIGTITFAVVAEYRYMRTRDEDWRLLARTFAVIATIFLGVGAAFGTLVEFGLVVLWSNFVTLIGSGLVLPFYFELYAFLMEVVLVPIYVFTWGRFRNGWYHWLIGLVAALGALYSAFNILAVMAAMSMRPPGLEIVELPKSIGQVIQYAAVFTSPSGVLNMFWSGAEIFIFHGILAALILSWSAIVGVTIYSQRRSPKPYKLKALRTMLPALTALIAVEGLVIGHYQGELVVQFDPLKLSAIEGMFWSGFKVDPLLSLLAYGDTAHGFWGYFSWPASIRPPSFLPAFYLGFMVAGGVLLGAWSLGLTLYYYDLHKVKGFGWIKGIERLLVGGGPYALVLLAALASIGGAVTAEVGRQPFVLVKAVPSTTGPPEITGIPVGLGGLYNPTLTLTPWLAALIFAVELVMPALAIYMVYLYLNRRVVE
ncbi:cytochrome ubiquinol oxidase subunit I [Conexivisphaera calida]|uniref:cytochrome ubiquinol oxidase subunit I n=1 Tax=Conexivisphaera calida TaxID=1874277 RepID=UPI001E31E6DF|nr:cytochrome ubiquinol oxidase subunit I [Conexivisphaera calida]